MEALGDGSIVAEGSAIAPLPARSAARALLACLAASARMLARHEIRQPVDRVGSMLDFADESHGRVYRETLAAGRTVHRPALLVVGFRLRWIRGWGHALFRAESLLNTPLFVGFPGFVSKLWVAADEHGVYRGVYQWDDPALADAYVRALWWVLALVSERASIRYAVVPGLQRDEVLADPALIDGPMVNSRAWWRLVTPQTDHRPQGGECGHDLRDRDPDGSRRAPAGSA
jgi:hypothetical protein